MSEFNNIPSFISGSVQQPFRYWVQTTIPSIYDDALSYQELLYRVIKILNVTLDNNNNMMENTENLHTAFSELVDYTNNYFNNLDLSSEVGRVLDKMVVDGFFSDYIDPILSDGLNSISVEAVSAIPQLVTSWLNNNITPTTPVIDKSLRIEDTGANSAITGNYVRTNKSAINEIGDNQLGITWKLYDDFLKPGFNMQTGVVYSTGQGSVRTRLLYTGGKGTYKINLNNANYKFGVWLYRDSSANQPIRRISTDTVDNYFTSGNESLIFTCNSDELYFRVCVMRNDGGTIDDNIDIPLIKNGYSVISFSDSLSKYDYSGYSCWDNNNTASVYSILDDIASNSAGRVSYINISETVGDVARIRCYKVNTTNKYYTEGNEISEGEYYEKPKVLVIGGIHGNEKCGTQSIMNLIPRLLYDPECCDMATKYEWWFVPVLNPWGFNNNQRNNKDNIDINRDFSDVNGFISPEAQAIRSIVQNNRFIGFCDLHGAATTTSNPVLLHTTLPMMGDNSMYKKYVRAWQSIEQGGKIAEDYIKQISGARTTAGTNSYSSMQQLCFIWGERGVYNPSTHSMRNWVAGQTTINTENQSHKVFHSILIEMDRSCSIFFEGASNSSLNNNIHSYNSLNVAYTAKALTEILRALFNCAWEEWLKE